MRADCGSWLLFVLGLTLSGIAHGRGFCDDPIPDDPFYGPVLVLRGGHCLQQRETGLAQFALSNDIGSRFQPVYSDVSLGPLMRQGEATLEFLFDVAMLYPSDVPMDAPVTVLEMGVGSAFTYFSNGPSEVSRTLTLSALHAADKSWTLRFDWLAVNASWSIVTSPAPVPLSSRVVTVPAGVTRFDIWISSNDEWKTVDLAISALDPNTLEEVQYTQFPKAFKVPDGQVAHSPMRLRSGVLGGELNRRGMKSRFAYRVPDISKDSP